MKAINRGIVGMKISLSLLITMILFGLGNIGRLNAAGVPTEFNESGYAKTPDEVFAVGVQVYLCKGGQWELQYPIAKLYNGDPESEGKLIGHHAFCHDDAGKSRATWSLNGVCFELSGEDGNPQKFHHQYDNSKSGKEQKAPNLIVKLRNQSEEGDNRLITKSKYIFREVIEGGSPPSKKDYISLGQKPATCKNGEYYESPYKAKYKFYVESKDVPAPPGPPPVDSNLPGPRKHEDI